MESNSPLFLILNKHDLSGQFLFIREETESNTFKVSFNHCAYFVSNGLPIKLITTLEYLQASATDFSLRRSSGYKKNSIVNVHFKNSYHFINVRWLFSYKYCTEMKSLFVTTELCKYAALKCKSASSF